jgi:hypothetical protein
MPTSTVTSAMEFFDALERGKGWDICQKWCNLDATFSCQAKKLDGVTTLATYAEWMKALYDKVPDGHYDLKNHAITDDGTTVLVYAVFLGTGLTPAGEPTAIAQDYVYIIEIEGEKIGHVTKVWNDKSG